MKSVEIEIYFPKTTHLLEKNCKTFHRGIGLFLRERGWGKVVESTRNPSGLVVRAKVFFLLPLIKYLIRFSGPLYRAGECFTLTARVGEKVFEIREEGLTTLRRRNVSEIVTSQHNLFPKRRLGVTSCSGAPPRTPHYKAVVESVFSSLNDLIIASHLNDVLLPSPASRPEHDASQTMTLTDFLDDLTQSCHHGSRRKHRRSARSLPVVREKKWTH
jgi:hypothetical protein